MLLLKQHLYSYCSFDLEVNSESCNNEVKEKKVQMMDSQTEFYRIILPMQKAVGFQRLVILAGQFELYMKARREREIFLNYFWVGFFSCAVQVLIPSIRRTIAFLRGVRIVNNLQFVCLTLIPFLPPRISLFPPSSATTINLWLNFHFFWPN